MAGVAFANCGGNVGRCGDASVVDDLAISAGGSGACCCP